MKYKCTKVVEAEPQKLTEEMAVRVKGSNAKIGDDGYKVTYKDGYESWSPKDVFESGYFPLEGAAVKDRVTEEDIKAKIVSVCYTVLEDGKTTICNIYLENGYTVRGESSCVNPENFDKKMGEEIAYDNAFDNIWQLEGYLLAEKLYRNHLDLID